MNIFRTIFAVLIALSLTLAPGVSAIAVAVADEIAASSTISASADTDMAMADMDMSDCMKAMGVSGAADKSDCKCCDAKSKCPDTANCMTKCCKAIGALKPAGKILAVSIVAYRQTEPAKPPSWVSTPPAPPPRS